MAMELNTLNSFIISTRASSVQGKLNISATLIMILKLEKVATSKQSLTNTEQNIGILLPTMMAISNRMISADREHILKLSIVDTI